MVRSPNARLELGRKMLASLPLLSPSGLFRTSYEWMRFSLLILRGPGKSSVRFPNSH